MFEYDGDDGDEKEGQSSDSGDDSGKSRKDDIPEIPEEELYDKDGKPLPWSQSKRFRKIYGQAKEGQKVTAALKDLGFSASDLPQIKEALGRLQWYEDQRAKFEQEERQNQSLDDDDKKELARLNKMRKELLKVMPELGKLLDHVQNQQQNPKQDGGADEAESRVIAKTAKTHMTDLLEDSGLLTDGMDSDERAELIEDWERQIVRRISKDEDDVALFREGNKKVITKHFKAALEATKKRYGSPKGQNIQKLAPRMSPKAGPISRQSRDEKGPARNVRDAAKEMQAEMQASRE